MLSISECVTLACLLEVAAPKPGNVHRGAEFEQLRFADFLVSATLIGPILERAAKTGVGQSILNAITATQAAVGTNTNLGIVLLLGPLAAVEPGRELRSGVMDVLRDLTPEDSNDVYEAIRVAKPGGLGQVDNHDVTHSAPPQLREAMRIAADRDSIARQYAYDFADVFDSIVPWLVEGANSGLILTHAIVHAQVQWMSQHRDSLIARKCGESVAGQACQFAKRVLDAGPPFSDEYEEELRSFDFWLRCDEHRRNPGTTADLIAAGLFVVLRDRLVEPPYR